MSLNRAIDVDAYQTLHTNSNDHVFCGAKSCGTARLSLNEAALPRISSLARVISVQCQIHHRTPR